VSGLGEERRLPDAGLAVDEDHCAPTGSGLVQHSAQAVGLLSPTPTLPRSHGCTLLRRLDLSDLSDAPGPRRVHHASGRFLGVGSSAA
jgi:hypothetical protein